MNDSAGTDAWAIEWQYVLGQTTPEIVATLCGVLGIILIARQNILGWPLGLVWTSISAYLCWFEWQLLSDAVLYVAYIPIQLYCWTVWVRRGKQQAETPFIPTWLSRRQQTMLILGAVAAVAIWATTISTLAGVAAWIPTPDLLVRDSTTTVLNFFAQFLQARKRMENWIGWCVVNLLGIHIYWVKEAYLYSFQYALFLLLGLYGWRKWQHARNTTLQTKGK
jgi:nicotinamide mononucleotide transporter